MLFLDYEDDSEEESGKDWDELEEEARKGKSGIKSTGHSSFIVKDTL